VITVFLADTDITSYVITDQWPEWVETSVKGKGLFEWQSQSFSFLMHISSPVTEERGQTVKIEVDGTERFYGFVDEVVDEWSDTPEIVAQPLSVALKDVMAGGTTTDDASGTTTHVFELNNATLSEALTSLFSWYNINRPDTVPEVSSWTIDVQDENEVPEGMYYPYGLIQFGNIDYTWVNLYEYPDPILQSFVETDESDWLGCKMDGDTLLIGVFTPDYADYEGGEQQDAEELFVVSSCPADGPSYYNRLQSFGIETPATWLARTDAPTSSDRISEAEILSYHRANAQLDAWTPVTILAAYDVERGTWVVVKANNRVYASWWGNPTLQTFTGRWSEESLASMVSLFAIVSGRLIHVENETVTAIPRWTTTATQITLPDTTSALSYSMSREGQDPAEIQIEQLDILDPASFGMKIRSGVINALKLWYSEQVGGDVVETEGEWAVTEWPTGLQMLATTNTGVVTGLDYATDGKRFRVKTIEESA